MTSTIDSPASAGPTSTGPGRGGPVRVTARLDEPLSRGLWLVKWLLVVPHLVVLTFLWAAFAVLTVVALVAILVTGHYPRSIFEFNLGVLRWSWRVGYYSYGVLGTDRYPPFTLGPAPGYPATLEIAYPAHLTRGLVLVKWLLAVPHYLIIAFFVGSGSYAAYSGTTNGSWTSGGLIGLLVLVVGIALLFTGRYPRGLFELLLGTHRWVLRVVAYTALMTDDYPPFRLDQGGNEPTASAFATPSATPATALDAHPTWSTGRIVTVVIGSVLLLGGIGAAVGGSAVLAADRGGRDADGFLNTPTRTFTGNGYALVFDPLELSNAATSQNVGALVGDVRIHATAPGPGVFVGIGPADAVDGYLASVERDRVVGYRTDSGAVQQPLSGGAPATPPAQQTFWVASAAGPGPQQLTWTVAGGRWAAVVMNADGSRPVVTDLSAGATAPGLRWVWIGQYIGAGIGLIAGALMVLFAVRRHDRRERA
ncbi:DUF4389 domain-containing protein [Pseudonocardia sp.]|uniref:DUF4389 domain-containing protein n=1 Tax=Pseudonocardia sp. TaxID=60912 RepID=UPI0026068616|nr:DUF4389 domain-containing protein [Pseudonocardia sp.]MCW2721308.1 hypothetical protein [Pseudonocardia sp.]